MENNSSGKPEYLSDKIGKEYKNWSPAKIIFDDIRTETEFGDIVFLTAPTGSGKTWFILHEFLKKTIHDNMKILYLVNRKVLKEQLESEIVNEGIKLYETISRGRSIHDYICIETYQHIEERAKNNILELEKFLLGFKVIVFDECHYFINDATFNTETVISFEVLTKLLRKSLQIFVSATLGKMKEIICSSRKRQKQFMENTKYAMEPNKDFVKGNLSYETYEYDAPMTYQYYIKPRIIKNERDIFLRLKEQAGNEKWLIFVDSIDKGKEFYKKIIDEKVVNEGQCTFIDAGYEKSMDALDDVKKLSRNSYISKKIIIATSVLDNGISFSDEQLRNIVIMADYEMEFLQMLGRKRRDGKIVNLYLFQRDEAYFENKLTQIRNIEKFLDYYAKKLPRFQECCDNSFEIEYIKCLFQNIYCINFNVSLQSEFLQAVYKSEVYYNISRKFAFVCNGMMYVNEFAIDKLNAQAEFYLRMIDELSENKYAFVKKQIEWMEMDYEDVEGELLASERDNLLKHVENIKLLLEKYIGMEMNSKMNKEMKQELKQELLYLIEYLPHEVGNINKKAIYNGVYKNDRILSAKNFNAISQYYELGLLMEKVQKIFIIRRK